MPLWTAVPTASGMSGDDQLVTDQAGAFAIATADQLRAALDSPLEAVPTAGTNVSSPLVKLHCYNASGTHLVGTIQYVADPTNGTWIEIKPSGGGCVLRMFDNGNFQWQTGSGFTELQTILRSTYVGSVYLDSANPAAAAARSRGAPFQTADVHQFVDSSNAVMSAVGPAGEWRPASLADSAAANNSVYYSTTANKLVYKDAGGTVNNLY